MPTGKNQKNILVITSDETLRTTVAGALPDAGFHTRFAGSQSEVLPLLDRESADVILFDMENFPVQELDLVHYAKMRSPYTEVIVLTTIGNLEAARNAIRKGASFYLIKPVSQSDIRTVLDKIALRGGREQEHLLLQQQVLSELMTGSPAMEKAFKTAMKIAPTSSTVLIGGESGSGKEFFARIIHRMSKYNEGSFVAMNCGAIPENLIESELFGYKKGAFTGADRDKPGLVEEAHLGTLLLDEVSELSPQAQVKLLRFLQERTFRRVGDTAQRSVNTRIMAATNKDLWKMAQEGRFREDLYYRLNVFYLYLPPLRERRETIPTLIKLFVNRFNTALDKRVNSISKGAEVLLANYSYPGNVRELENIVEHAMVLCDGTEITEKELPDFMFRNRLMLSGPGADAVSGDEILPLTDVEKKHIEQALRRMNFNYSEVAKKLEISRSTLWRKIKTYRIKAPDDTRGAE